MKSRSVLQPTPGQQTHENDTYVPITDEGHKEALQTQRQAFDMAIDEVVEGLQEIQLILNRFKATCFAVPRTEIAPTTRLQVQRTSHHCARLMAEVLHLLQPFSQGMQAFSMSLSNKNTEQSKEER